MCSQVKIHDEYPSVPNLRDPMNMWSGDDMKWVILMGWANWSMCDVVK